MDSTSLQREHTRVQHYLIDARQALADARRISDFYNQEDWVDNNNAIDWSWKRLDARENLSKAMREAEFLLRRPYR